MAVDTLMLATLRHEVGKTGDDGQAFINGTLDGGNEPTDTFNNANPTDDMTLGATAAGSLNFSGDIAEVMIYSGALSESVMDEVNDYLGTKYGLTINDPSSSST